MSSSQRRRWLKRGRVLCAACQERKARFRYRKEVRADRDHTLCFECYRSEVNRTRARRLVEGRGASGGLSLNDRQRAHRERMLDHLQRTVGPAEAGHYVLANHRDTQTRDERTAR